MKIYGLLILSLSFFSCQSDTDKLFWINENTKHRSDFLFMAESTNVLPLSIDSVGYYLTVSEIGETELLINEHFQKDSIFYAPVLFKNFGKLYQTDSFKLFVLFRVNNKANGRDYKFTLRTYTLDWEIVDSYDLAVWNEQAIVFCFGSINKKMIIEKRCKDSELSEIMQILEDGKIVMTSFNKP